MVSLRSSFVFSFLQRNVTLIIQFSASLIIARLLTPHEIGVFSIGAVIVSFSHIVRDMGVSNYVIQEEELTSERIRSAQAIVWITAWGIALVLNGLSFWAGHFYAEPGVTEVMQVLSISFLFLPVGAVSVALLTRDMAFRRIFVINICSTLANSITAIYLAWSGFGFISLAWAAVAGASVTALGSILYRRAGQPWLPGFKEWRRVFAAGTKLSAASMFYEIGLGGPELIAGRLLGFELLAYFSRGFGAAMLLLRAIVESLMPVAVPYFAKESRAGQELKLPYLRGIAYMSVLAFPAFVCLGLMAKPIILLLYGWQWEEAILPLQVASIGLAFLAVTNVAGAVLVGSGEIGANLRMLAFFEPFKVAMVILGATKFGLVGVSIGVACGNVLLSMRCFYLVNCLVGVSFWEFIKCLLPSCYITFFVGLATWGAMVMNVGLFLEKIDENLLQMLLGASGAGVGWVLGLILTKHALYSDLLEARKS
jgi:O-antigen/teichoic acid export membrane protein